MKQESEWDDDDTLLPTLGDYRELQRQHDELKTKLHRRGYQTLMTLADTLERAPGTELALRHLQDDKTYVSTEVLRAMASTLPEMQGGMLSDWKGSQEQKVLAINASIDRYYLALDRRQDGGIAGHVLIDDVQEIMGRNWVQGEVINGKHESPVEFSPIVIVLDAETLGRGERAVIGTIGAVARNVMSRKDLGQFYTRINLELEQPGREIHEDVTEWWDGMASSNPAAWREMFDPDLPRGDLPTALASLAEFIAMIKAHCAPGSYVQVMGNGPEFDNAIMAHAYESHGMALPWQFRANQSLRTPVWLGRLLLGIDPKYDGVFSGTQHHALHDAQHEAETLQAIIDNFRNFTP